MSPHHLTSLWPHLITELVTVFLRIERELISTDSQRSKNSIMGTIESFFTFNGLTTSKEKWLRLYLEACKLLDLFFSLECEDIPHFQSYRWAFVDTPGVDYDHFDSMKLNHAPLDNGSTSVEKSRTPTTGGREKPQDKIVSKLSVMNAPLSSKLRKNEKKSSKEKANAERKSEPVIQMKFAPYLSKLTVLLSQQYTSPATVNEKPTSRKQTDRALFEKEASAIGGRIGSSDSSSVANSRDASIPHNGTSAQATCPLSANSPSSDETASSFSYSDVSRIVHHPLEFVKIDSVFELLPFLESVSSLKKEDKIQVSRIKREHLEELTEKDFQENLSDKSK